MLAPVWPTGRVAGVDFGHSHVRVAVADLSGTVLAEQSADVDVDNDAGSALTVAAGLVGELVAALGDDPATQRVLREAGCILGRVTADLCNLLNPEAVIVGGELGLGGDALLCGVRESIDRYAQPRPGGVGLSRGR